MKKVKTPEQVKAEFHRKGWTFSGWARQNGYREQEVYRVLNGFTKPPPLVLLRVVRHRVEAA